MFLFTFDARLIEVYVSLSRQAALNMAVLKVIALKNAVISLRGFT